MGKRTLIVRRRFERVGAKQTSRVRLIVDGARLRRLESTIGRPRSRRAAADAPEDGDESEVLFESPSAAQKGLSKAARALLAAGWEEIAELVEPGSTAVKGVSTSNSDLEAAIAANPEDLEAYRVYADWLTAQGDVRGELVLADLAVLRRPDDGRAGFVASTLRKTFGKLLLGPVFAWRTVEVQQAGYFGMEARGFIPGLSWHLGFLRAARLARTSLPTKLHTMVEALLTHPCGHLLEHLVLGPSAHFDGEDYSETLRVLEGSRPATLRALSVGEGYDSLMDVSGFFRLPGLERLRLFDRGLELGQPGELQLRAFALEAPAASAGFAEWVHGTRWPKLEALTIPAGLLTAFAQGVEPEKLRALCLTSVTDRHVEALANSPLAPRLSRLTLSQTTDVALDALVRRADRFDRLETLRVERTAVPAALREALRASIAEVEVIASYAEPDLLDGAWADRTS